MSPTGNFYLENDQFYHPKLQINNQDRKQKVLNLVDDLILSKSQINRFRNQFIKEIEIGLGWHKDFVKTSKQFPMINTYVNKFPNGTEKGHYLALDIGGSNLRVALVHLNPPNKPEITFEYFDVPIEKRQGGAAQFFGHLASSIQDFMKKHLPGQTEQIEIGLTFSFGYDQLAINRGRCFQFGIATNLEDAIGRCPVEMLQEQIDILNLPVKVAVLANDSTTTLLWGRTLNPNTFISLILGSGSNVAYIEEVDKYQFDKSPELLSSKQFVINSECVFYGDENQIDYVKSKYDFELDAMSLLPLSYTYEKMIGGAFLGELFRLVLCDLIRNGLILSGKFTPKIVKQDTIKTPEMSLIDSVLLNSNVEQYHEQIKKFLRQTLDYNGLHDLEDTDDLQIIGFICQLITNRSALLSAAMLSAFVIHISNDKMFNDNHNDNNNQNNKIMIACDGSLFGKHCKMPKLLNGFLKQILIESKSIKSIIPDSEVFYAENGSCLGAAMIAASLKSN